jgi:inner membrane protein involved in colicin E2 resistance
MRGRIFGIVVVFALTSVAWVVLGAVTSLRKEKQSEGLRTSVSALWGSPQVQSAPELAFHWRAEGVVERVEIADGKEVKVKGLVLQQHQRPVQLSSSRVDVSLASDLRRKGLTWYSLYDVKFGADYGYLHTGEAGELEVVLALPDASAMYDDFVFTIDGADLSSGFDSSGGRLRARIPVRTGQRVAIRAAYRSRGLDQWKYQPSQGVGRLEDFSLTMHTDFADIDFPAGTMSPSRRARDGEGWTLNWAFQQVVSGNGMGMITPSRIQPGDLAAELALSAPVSLFLYFFVIFVLAALRGIDLHPINYLLIAGAFFAFHLLFAYSVDHLPVEYAFALCSLVSVFLVVSYLRLVVSTRFAWLEAGLAQLLYLVGFSLAHFWEGYTGLTSTVLAIVTLYAVMQLTGRVRWSELLGAKAEPQ